jgi:hypothetical protein
LLAPAAHPWFHRFLRLPNDDSYLRQNSRAFPEMTADRATSFKIPPILEACCRVMI